MTQAHKLRVLIVDDSAIARDLLDRGLSMNPRIEVVGKASDAFSARDKIVLLAPDAITLDVEMPRMDGIEFLKRLLPQYPIPVIIVSAVTAEGSMRALEALEAGAVDVVAKPDGGNRDGLMIMIEELGEKLLSAAATDRRKIGQIATARNALHKAPVKRKPVKSINTTHPFDGKIVALGASTGGTAVLTTVISQMPDDMPPVVIVQHMPPVFTRMFADSLNRITALEVSEAKEGDIIERGHVYIAPGDYQMTIARQGLTWALHCRHGEKVSGHRPSVDVLFKSVAQEAGNRAVGVLMTGMGRDGAEGMLEMRSAGARCFAQDEESSVVFGMPKEAWDNGSAEMLVSANTISATILTMLKSRAEARSAT